MSPFNNGRFWVRLSAVVSVFCLACGAQMTPGQKSADLTQLAATLAKNYGPIEWKRAQFHFDLLNIGDWVKRAAASRDDLDFYDVCVDYVSNLHDAHTAFYLPSDFRAVLPFRVDLYDGRPIVETLSSSLDSQDNFPIRIGDELVTIDGVSAAALMEKFRSYATLGNTVSTQRLAAALLTSRAQTLMPRAPEVNDISEITVKHPSGASDTVKVTWAKTGTPLALLGPVISPHAGVRAGAGSAAQPGSTEPLQRLRRMSIPPARFLQGLGGTRPVFTALPPNFQVRSGNRFTDVLFSGTYQTADGLRIGLIRIPAFDYRAVVTNLDNEVAYMQENTDGLVLDIMRNPGGDACLAQAALRRIIPYSFRMIGLEIRVTRGWLDDFKAALADAIASNASQDVINQYREIVSAVQQAYLTPSGRTPPLPVCGSTLQIDPPGPNDAPLNVYTGPVLLLTDEFSASAADLFAAVFQDAKRGLAFGARTMGAGGNVEDFSGVTTYSEGEASITESLMVRKSGAYVENLGVQPDIPAQYMTIDNLNTGGRAFVEGFTRAISEAIRAGRSGARRIHYLPLSK